MVGTVTSKKAECVESVKFVHVDSDNVEEDLVGATVFKV